MSFQENIKYYREKAGYSARSFAEKLNIPYTTYLAYEKTEREPKYSLLIKIADILNVSLDDLLGRVPEPITDGINYDRCMCLYNIFLVIEKQLKQWGDESELTPHQWLGLIQEEVGEIAQAVNETYLPNKTKTKLGGKENIQAEIYQAAALLIRLSENLEKENKNR